MGPGVGRQAVLAEKLSFPVDEQRVIPILSTGTEGRGPPQKVCPRVAELRGVTAGK